MSSLFDLFSGFMEPILDLFPRIARRPASNEWLVVDRWTSGPRECARPIVYIPSITHVSYIPRHEQTIDCGLQRATTADSQSVAVNAVVRFKVDDPVLCRETLGEEYEETVGMIVRAAVVSTVSGHNYSHCQDLLTCESSRIADEIVEQASYFGILLTSFTIEDWQTVIPLSVLN